MLCENTECCCLLQPDRGALQCRSIVRDPSSMPSALDPGFKAAALLQRKWSYFENLRDLCKVLDSLVSGCRFERRPGIVSPDQTRRCRLVTFLVGFETANDGDKVIGGMMKGRMPCSLQGRAPRPALSYMGCPLDDGTLQRTRASLALPEAGPPDAASTPSIRRVASSPGVTAAEAWT